MATLFHFPISHIVSSHKLFFSSSSPICLDHHHHPLYLLIYRPKTAVCASIKKPRARTKLASNLDLCNDILEFLSAVGLPEDHVPTMKELSEHGRQDLAHRVRRRGYKLVRELLSTYKKPTEEGSGKDLVENFEDESLSQDTKITDLAHDVPLLNEASGVVDYMNDANNGRVLNSEELNAVSGEMSVYSSLEEQVANFIQYGELDSVEDSGSEIFNERGSDKVEGFSEKAEGFAERQNVAETESGIDKGRTDLILCNTNGTEISNGNSVPATQYVGHPSEQSVALRKDSLSTEDLTMAEGKSSADIEPQKVENQAEINHLKFMLHQKELELTQLKQQIEEEKRALSILQTKAEREISEAQKLILEKDAELAAVEESLSGLKEVEILYWADAGSVEIAGSFNGWHHKIRMDLQASSIVDPTAQDTPASSSITNPNGQRNPQLWRTVLWLYPGIYEIKFVVDGHWTNDPQREIVTRGHIQNNVLRVER